MPMNLTNLATNWSNACPAPRGPFVPSRLRVSRARAFTLIELLIVIGVLGILITLGVLGFRQLSTQNKQKVTYTTLANCVSLLKELSSQAGVTSFAAGTLAAPGVVTPDNPTVRDAAANDARAKFFNVAWQVPALRKSLENFPQDQRLPSSTPGGAFVPTDAWNNPIIFVPKDGLTGVTLPQWDPLSNSYIRVPFNINGTSVNVTAPDGRPFFASAGPDGNFTTGEDNVYSFEAQ
jgi:prepilin-type N-terminal cleavage/methylation domain-containing protein